MTTHDFVTVGELVERIKDRLSKRVGERCVFDHDVATALGITKGTLSSAKFRNTKARLLEPILKYCMREGIDPIALLIKEKSNQKEKKCF